jgi:hypothetical protein
MKKFLVLLFVSSFISFHSISQEAANIRPAALGISFSLVDYTTAQRIRSSSLTSVLNKKQTASFKEMSPAIAVTYFKGLRNHIDFAGTLLASFTNINLEGRTNTNDALLLEADASVNLKMLSENYFFSPYISAGVGFSSYDKKLGAFIPLGGGLKFNIFDEAAIYITSQYRVPVTTETATYHFVHGFGIAGIIGKKNGTTEPTLRVP